MNFDFEEFYNKNYTAVRKYLYNHVGNLFAAEDIAQDVFEYCYRNMDKYDPEKSSRTTWLYVVVNSRLKNYYRDKKETADFDLLENMLGDSDEDMDRAIYLQQLRDALAKAMENLPEKQRQVILMKFFENKSHSEISRELMISEANSRVLLTRATAALQKYMTGFSGGD